MSHLVRWCLGNRAVVILFSLILIGAGLVSVFRVNQELLPSVEFPSVFILVPEPGAGPDQIDRDVTTPLVQGLTGLPRIQHINSTSSQGFSQVQISFDLDSSLKDDQDAVNQRLQQVTLPSTAGRPVVQTFDFNAAPSLTYSLAARDNDLARATAEANNVIVPALSGAQGAAQIKVSGGAQRAINITLDGAELAKRGVSMQDVQRALSGAQVDLPAGESLQAGKSLPVEVTGQTRTAADLQSLVVATPPPPPRGPAPAPVRLKDVAAVTDGPSPINGISRTNSAPSLEIQVIRAPDANAVTLSDDIRHRVAGLHLNSSDDLQLISDTADGIRSSLKDLAVEGALGALLAIFVIFLFLRSLRATLVTAVSLPASVLVAVLGTALGGFSLNVLTLAGLTIAVGRIVDDSIVVLENSYRHLQQGDSPIQAAYRGATEVSAAIFSSTLTTVGVFLPIGLVGGIISRFFLPFSITVTISLLASLLVALTLIPVLVSFVLQRRANRTRVEVSGRLARIYRPILGWALSRAWHKAVVLLLAVAMLGGAATTVAKIPKNFFDFGGSTELNGAVTLPPGTTADQTSQQLAAFESIAEKDSAVSLVQVTIASSDFGGYTAGFTTNQARLVIKLKSRVGASDVAKRLHDQLDRLYGGGNSQLAVQQLGPPSSGFQASVSGNDPAALKQASDMLVAELRGDSELANVKSGLAADKPEIQVTVDPAKAAARGLSPQAVAQALASALSNRAMGTLGPGGPPITMQLDPQTVGADNLATLPIAPGATLQDVATISDTVATPSINRVDGTRQVTVSGDVTAADTQGAASRATTRIQHLSLPGGITLASGSSNQDISSAFSQMLVAIGIAIAIVFLILVAFFRSVVTPLVILLTMPLALIGSFVALYAFHQALGLPALLGVLMVFGIVVSNAILLIDFVERNRTTLPLDQALSLAASVRIRPIMMTAVATIAALIPVAAGLSVAGGGGLISQSLALVVEGGLISSTGLTLLVIPIVYSLARQKPRPQVNWEDLSS